MGLFQKACETFDTFQDMVGKQIEGQEPLAPCSHSVIRADLEITIDRDGRFVAARAVDKKEPKIIIPVTEESAGRTSGIYAHPLCDQIKYIAPYDEQRHSQYVDGLKSWANSEFSHPKLLPILNYVERESILPDLVSTGLIHLDDKGLPDKEKLLIRWRIIGLGEQSGGTWEDLTLFETFRCYYQYKKTQADRVLCMVSGTEVLPAQQHPKGVVALNGNAKLVSENDKDNFTFRDRFTKPDQAATVGYEASQKAHNALRWVIANEGVAMGGRMFVCWSPQGVLLPKPHNPFFSSQTDDPPTPSAYSLLSHDCAWALESVGLDSYVGFLHRNRPGRNSLALDLMEEFRPCVADRFVLTCINNRVFQKSDFVCRENGGVLLSEGGRRTFLQRWQERKKDSLTHPFLGEKVPWGLVPYLQALLLARYLRGDLDAYPPFLWK